MGEFSLDASTGYLPEEELVQLAEAPEDLAAGAANVQSFSLISVAISVATYMAGACPTSACTKHC